MAYELYVNLAVEDLNRSKAFFERLGLSFNPAYTDQNGACLVIGAGAAVMLLTKPFFQSFTPKSIADTRHSSEVLLALACHSRVEVDELLSKAVDAGGRLYKETEDQDFMYGGGFEDLDGHLWEVFYMVETPE